MAWSGIIEKYREFLPVSEGTPVVTLNEGNTSLIRATNIREKTGIEIDLYLKFEIRRAGKERWPLGMSQCGRVESVTDEEILDAYGLVASSERVFCEPASAASIAGVIKLYKEGYLKRGETVVCTLTGNGLKDLDTVVKIAKKPVKVKGEMEAFSKVLEGML